MIPLGDASRRLMRFLVATVSIIVINMLANDFYVNWMQLI